MIDTDTGWPQRDGRLRIVRFRCALVAAVGLWAGTAMGQGLEERMVVLARTPSGRPVTVYGAAEKPLLLLFDVPLGKGAIRAPGVEIRRQLADPKALVLTPSRGLASSRSSVPVMVPLEGGAVALTLAFKPEAPDGCVRIFGPRGEQPWAHARKEPQSLHLVAAAATSHASSPRFEMTISPGEATVSDAATKCRINLVVRTPEAPKGYAVEIRSADRAFCESHGP